MTPNRNVTPPAGRVVAALFLLAAAVRLLFLFAYTDRGLPFSVFYYGDSRLYREFALSVLSGVPFDQGIPFHPPAFAYVLAAVIAAVGEHPAAMRAILAVVAASAVPLAYLLGRSLWGPGIALGGALLLTFFLGLLVLAVSPNAETIYLPLLLAQALFAVYLADSWAVGRRGPALRWAAASGVVLGLGSLTRAEHLGFAVIVPLVLVLRRPRGKLADALACIAMFLGVASLVVTPWTVRNAREIARFNSLHAGSGRPLPELVLVSNYGALNFAMANHPDADGTFKPEIATGRRDRSSLDLSDPRQLDWYLSGYRKGMEFLLSDPLRSARLVVRKLGLASGAFALGFGASDLPSGLTGTRRPVDLFVPDRSWWMLAPLLLAAWGAFATRQPGGRRSVVWLIAAHKAATVAAFFGYARLAGHLLPFVFLLVAAGLSALFPRASTRRILFAGGAVAVGALLLQLGVCCAAPRRLLATGYLDPASGKLVQDAEVRLAPEADAGAF